MDDEKRAQARPLENMSIPELESLLQQYFIVSGPDDDPSVTEYMKKIAEVIMQKEEEAGIAELPKVEEAWERFQDFYLEGAMEETSNVQNIPAASVMSHKGSRRTIRRVIIIAAMIAVLLAMTVVPVAGHRNLFEMIATWTEEQFTFQSGSETENKGDTTDDMLSQANEQKEFRSDGVDKSKRYDTIEEALADYGIKKAILPKALPDGFVQTELDVHEFSQGDVLFFAQYAFEDQYIIYSVMESTRLLSNTYEKNDIEVETYKTDNGLTFFLFANEGNETAACYYDTLEIGLSTDLDRTTLKQLLDTIS